MRRALRPLARCFHAHCKLQMVKLAYNAASETWSARPWCQYTSDQVFKCRMERLKLPGWVGRRELEQRGRLARKRWWACIHSSSPWSTHHTVPALQICIGSQVLGSIVRAGPLADLPAYVLASCLENSLVESVAFISMAVAACQPHPRSKCFSDVIRGGVGQQQYHM